jgi:23S rRNA (guanine745-N1)-methyltransferase
MRPEVVAALACPHDQRDLELVDGGLGCAGGHRIDLARQGYATLTAAPLRHRGDSAPLLERRARVHAAGLLGVVHEALRDLLARNALPAGHVLDAGAGTGSYLATTLEALPTRFGIAVDVSRSAARRAARAHPRAGSVVADLWDGLPIRTGAVAVLLDVFAPRAPAEFARVLAPGGALLVVTPTTRHLAELREPFGLLEVPAGKADRLAQELGPAFEERERITVSTAVRVDHSQAADLAGMGPRGHHLDARKLATIAASLPASTTVTVEVCLVHLERRPPPVSAAPARVT